MKENNELEQIATSGNVSSTIQDQTIFGSNAPIGLTSTQMRIIEILKTAKSDKYPLADWYLGAIYAVKNTYNPDRFSQAAQSLRELLEKLPRVFVKNEIPSKNKTEIPGEKYDPIEQRRNIHKKLRDDKGRYKGVWKGKIIDKKLDKTIGQIENYLELCQRPTRNEHIHSAMNKLDPMHNTLDQRIKVTNAERFQTLWNTLEGITHHSRSVGEDFFLEQLTLMERLIIDLLAPITAEDQKTIRTILANSEPEQCNVEKLLELIKRRGSNSAYFFNTVDNPIWLAPLIKNDFFAAPPSLEATEDGKIIVRIWYPVFYLQRISEKEPNQVVDIICRWGKITNPRILREILSIACVLKNTDLSLRLESFVTDFLRSPYRSYVYGNDLIINILQKWGKEPGASRTAALKIIQYVVSFQPDPKSQIKESLRTKKPDPLKNWNTSLEPAPRFDQWEYQQILEKGVRPLADHEPYKVASILIGAVANMIKLGIHQDDLKKRRGEDYSEIWCKRLDRPDDEYPDIRVILVQTLVYACEQVYNRERESIHALDNSLSKKHWKVFQRLRQLLYALYPNDQTLPWIRELILGHDDYAKKEHHYEFQMMIRNACEHFGPRLLSEEEQKKIVDDILSGPSKKDFREWAGDSYSDEVFLQRQSRFHRKQLRPFATLLNGKIKEYFNELEGDPQAKPLSDDSYLPSNMGKVGWVSYQSPKSAEDLTMFGDDELLTYLNDWNEEHRDKDNWLIEINISALADAFQVLFKEKIVQDSERLSFWMSNRDRIERPIYAVAMLKAMLEFVKKNDFDKLEQWIDFCAWVLSHKDLERIAGQAEPRDESRDYPDWGTSRRAVVDLIEACVSGDSDAPITARSGLAALLKKACLSSYWRLDHETTTVFSRYDLITEAINNTRSRALEALVYFGFWVRRHLQEDTVQEVTEILDMRLAQDVELPLTRPEHALLGMHFGDLCTLNKNWAVAHQGIIFPRGNIAVWQDTFGSYIRFNHPMKNVFEILDGEFSYAIDNLNALMDNNEDSKVFVDRLGEYLLIYYLWDVSDLSPESLLVRFYDKTENDRECWAELFDHAGRLLKNTSGHMDKAMIDRVIAYFDWRFQVGEPLELQKFTFWLEAECLSNKWRLISYSKILDIAVDRELGLSLRVRALKGFLSNHQALVVECFAKITDAMGEGTQMYILNEDAKPILRAGLNADDPQTRQNAERALENLLKLGRSEFLDVDE
ncbi:MAG: hypothetical protein KBF14_01655 [Synergistaceae bacterium]|nr:hypothetical protein [Synergistaceae bacterium]